MAVRTHRIVVRHLRRRGRRPNFEPKWPVPRGIWGDVFQREDGAWTRNVNGFDIAELVCQFCVVGSHHSCVGGECTDSGFSCCPCNGQFTLIGAASAANGKERP